MSLRINLQIRPNVCLHRLFKRNMFLFHLKSNYSTINMTWQSNTITCLFPNVNKIRSTAKVQRVSCDGMNMWLPLSLMSKFGQWPMFISQGGRGITSALLTPIAQNTMSQMLIIGKGKVTTVHSDECVKYD
jgi:hypothetical protein